MVRADQMLQRAGETKPWPMPTHVKYLVIGAGIHGLSTAWHLAEKLKARGQGGGEDVLVIDKTADRGGRERHRLRRGAQQLLSAGHARAHGPMRRGLGERPRGVQLPPGRLHCKSRPRRCAKTSPRSTPSSRRSATTSAFIEGRGRVHRLHDQRCSATGRRAASLRYCTRRRAATPTTRPRCTASRPRPRIWACAFSPRSR